MSLILLNNLDLQKKIGVFVLSKPNLVFLTNLHLLVCKETKQF